LITGPDAAAQTALFLATAGLWDGGKGRILRPAPEGIRFMPKQPLTVRCKLRAQLVDTDPARPVRDEDIWAVLEKLGLGPRVRQLGGLDADVHSPSALSPGEQRLLSFARVLLAAPRFVFVEKMDGDLSAEQVAELYHLLKEAGISYVTVGDRHNLVAYHDTVLELPGEGRWQIEPGRHVTEYQLLAADNP
jgi:putative ATP-binding cassette transporter